MSSRYKDVKNCVARRVEWMRDLKRRPCEQCGRELPPEKMHFHHRDEATKEFTVAAAVFRIGRDRLLAEIAKCDLLCEDCHITLHHGYTRSPCGTARKYMNGCRCDACREANRVKRGGQRRLATAA